MSSKIGRTKVVNLECVMKLLHLLNEDLKRVAWLLLLNAVLAAAVAYPFSSLADGMIDPETGFSRLKRLGPFLFILYFLITGILTQRLVGKDSICDVDAFWLSKPVDGLQSLASKGIILLVVYFAIPWVFLWAVATNSGVGMPWGTLVWHGYWTLWFAPALVFFAVHTKGLSTMLVGATGFAAALFVGYNFFAQFYLFGGRPEMGGYFHLAAYLVYLVSALTSIVLPFSSRRLTLPRVIAGIGALVAIMIPLLGLKGYLGPSDQFEENEAIGRSMAIEEPVLIVNPDVRSRKNLTMAKPSLEIETVLDDFLFYVDGARVSFRAAGEPVVVFRLKGKGFDRTLADAMGELKEWDLESVYNLRKSSIDMEGDIQPLGPGNISDPAGQWDLKISLARFTIENVEVVPFEDGQEIEYGGVRTVLRQAGSSTDYSRYLIIEYSYEDLATDSPIQFHSFKEVERLNRVYFLKGKSGRLWQRKSGLVDLGLTTALGLRKEFGFLGAIEPLTDGVDDEELELVAIDVRYLGKVTLRTEASGKWIPATDAKDLHESE